MKQNQFEYSDEKTFTLASSNVKLVIRLIMATTVFFCLLLIGEIILLSLIMPINISSVQLDVLLFILFFLIVGFFAIQGSIPVRSKPELHFTTTEMTLTLLAPEPFDRFQYERHKITSLVIQEYSLLGRLYILSFIDGSILRIPEISWKPTALGEAIERFGPSFETRIEDASIFRFGGKALLPSVLLWSLITSMLIGVSHVLIPSHLVIGLLILIDVSGSAAIFSGINLEFTNDPDFLSSLPKWRRLAYSMMLSPVLIYLNLRRVPKDLSYSEQKNGIVFPFYAEAYPDEDINAKYNAGFSPKIRKRAALVILILVQLIVIDIIFRIGYTIIIVGIPAVILRFVYYWRYLHHNIDK